MFHSGRHVAALLGMAAGLTLVLGSGIRADQAAGEKKIAVSVLDASSKPVPGLTKADFVVKEGDEAREVVKVEQNVDPLFVEVMVDTTTYLTRIQREVRAAVSAFVKQLQTADPKAQIALAEVGESAVRVENFTVKGSDLEKSIQYLIAKPDQSAVFLDGMVDAAKDLQKKPTPRRVLLLFTIDESPEQSATKTAATVVRQAGIIVWTVSYRGTSNNGGAREVVLDSVTKQSGGGRLVVGTPATIGVPFAMLADLLANQYVVTYTRPAAASAPESIQVGVQRGNKLYASVWPPK